MLAGGGPTADGRSPERVNARCQRAFTVWGMTTHTPSPLPLLYTRQEAAALLGVSDSWLRDQVSLGNVPHIRLGQVKGVRFRHQDVEDIITARQRPVIARPEVEHAPETPDPLASLRSLRAPGAKQPGVNAA